MAGAAIEMPWDPGPTRPSVLGVPMSLMGYHGMLWASMGFGRNTLENLGFFRFGGIAMNLRVNGIKWLSLIFKVESDQCLESSRFNTGICSRKVLIRGDVPGVCRGEMRQMTCKPGSVRGLAAPGWPFLWDDRCRPPHATYPRIWRGSRPVRASPNPSSYAVLLPAGFTVPRPLPAARCALTAPFHPYRRAARSRVIGGLFSVALSLGSRPPAVNRRRSSMEPGLSSLPLKEESGHPVIWPR